MIEAQLLEITEAGKIQIGFQPPKSLVPDSWDDLWSKEKRPKMNSYEIEALDEALLDILHVVFIKNSEELD